MGKVGRVNKPWVWALIYLLAVPVFAGLYGMRPLDFHEPGIAKERAYLDLQGDGLVTGLTDAVRSGIVDRGDGLVRVSGGGPIGGGPGTIRPSDVFVKSIQLSDGEVTVTIRFDAHLTRPTAVTTDDLVVSIPWRYQSAVVSPSGAQSYMWYPPSASSGLLKVDAAKLLPPQMKGGPATLVLDRSVTDRLNRFLKAWNGDPYYANGRFPRMLYVSATTITTLGPGDVQAVSSRARMLVATEAVLGVVLAGLFVSAVAQKFVERSKDRNLPEALVAQSGADGEPEEIQPAAV